MFFLLQKTQFFQIKMRLENIFNLVFIMGVALASNSPENRPLLAFSCTGIFLCPGYTGWDRLSNWLLFTNQTLAGGLFDVWFKEQVSDNSSVGRTGCWHEHKSLRKRGINFISKLINKLESSAPLREASF